VTQSCAGNTTISKLYDGTKKTHTAQCCHAIESDAIFFKFHIQHFYCRNDIRTTWCDISWPLQQKYVVP